MDLNIVANSIIRLNKCNGLKQFQSITKWMLLWRSVSITVAWNLLRVMSWPSTSTLFTLGGFGLAHTKTATSKTVYKSASSVTKHYRTEDKKIFHYQCMLCSFGHEEHTTMKKHMENKHKIQGLVLRCPNLRYGRLFGKKKKQMWNSQANLWDWHQAIPI